MKRFAIQNEGKTSKLDRDNSKTINFLNYNIAIDKNNKIVSNTLDQKYIDRKEIDMHKNSVYELVKLSETGKYKYVYYTIEPIPEVIEKLNRLKDKLEAEFNAHNQIDHHGGQ